MMGMTGVGDGWCHMLCSMCLSALPALHPLLQHQLRTHVSFQYLLLLSVCPRSSLKPRIARSMGTLSLLMFVLLWTYRGRQHPRVSLSQWGMESVDGSSFFPIHSTDVSGVHSTQLFRGSEWDRTPRCTLA